MESAVGVVGRRLLLPVNELAGPEAGAPAAGVVRRRSLLQWVRRVAKRLGVLAFRQEEGRRQRD
jgi:hypothetical protein